MNGWVSTLTGCRASVCDPSDLQDLDLHPLILAASLHGSICGDRVALAIPLEVNPVLGDTLAIEVVSYTLRPGRREPVTIVMLGQARSCAHQFRSQYASFVLRKE